MINYSKTIVYYDIFFRYMVPYAIDPANAARLGISSATILALSNMKTAWDMAMGKYLNPETYGKLSTAKINTLWKSDKTYTNSLAQTLKSNPSLELDDSDYLFFGIHKDVAPRSNIPKPTAEAAVILKATNHLNNEFRVFDVENPTRGAKPKDVRRIKIVMLVQKADVPPPTLDMLVPELESGSMNFDIPFTEDEIGKIAYIAVCFSNDAGDGEYSAIIACPII